MMRILTAATAACLALPLIPTSLAHGEAGAGADPGRACDLPRSTPEAEGIPQAAVDALVREAEAANSSGLVLLRNGRLVGEWYFGGEAMPIQTMSATKSVVAMAVGRLLETGALESIDEPVATWYPEWRQGRKRDVTVRMLLNHTSGLQNVPNAGAEIYPAPDAVRLALAAELSDTPGARFSYNNKAVNLLSGVVAHAAGVPLDEYVARELLAPLCIPEREWYRDAAGVPHAMAGLELTPLELAKLGELMRLGGVWGGRRLLPETWVHESTAVSQRFTPRAGLLWWLTHEWTHYYIDDDLVAEWRAAGADDAFLAVASPLVGRRFDGPQAAAAAADSLFGEGLGREEWARHTTERGAPSWRFETGPLRAYNADGYLGQYLVVVPGQNLVAVRMKGQAPDHTREHNFAGFVDAVLRLVPASD